jgi:hypothetical protein
MEGVLLAPRAEHVSRAEQKDGGPNVSNVLQEAQVTMEVGKQLTEKVPLQFGADTHSNA